MRNSSTAAKICALTLTILKYEKICKHSGVDAILTNKHKFLIYLFAYLACRVVCEIHLCGYDDPKCLFPHFNSTQADVAFLPEHME